MKIIRPGLMVCLLLLTSLPIKSAITLDEQFGSWSISKKLFDFILQLVPAGGTILELGSGWASGQLSKYYTVYSIEHNLEWMDLYETNYIYAPIVNSWFDPEVLKKELPQSYDLILIDGPPGPIGRYGFYTYLHLFNTKVPIIFDDTNRAPEMKLLVDVSRRLKRPYQLYREHNKSFAIIRP